MFMSSPSTFIDGRDGYLESIFDSFDFDGLNADFTSDESGMLGCLANSKDDFLSTLMQPRLIFDLPSRVSTPSSGSEICTPPFTNHDIAQLDFSPLQKDQSFMSSPSPLSTLGSLSPLTNSNASSPMHFDQTDFPSDGFGGNALGLDDGFLLNGLDGQIQNYSSSLPASEVSVATAQQLLPAPDESILSPLVVATAQLSIENGLRISSEEHTHLQTVNPSATYEVPSELSKSSNSPVLLGASTPAAAEGPHSAPAPAQKKSVKRLPPGSVRNARARRVRQVRAAAAKQKSYRELSASPAPESLDIIPIVNNTPYRAVDECEYGFREWYRNERGTRVTKWKCRKCHQVVGRRPDLHRHFKKCVMKEKYYCVDVIHSDGTIWHGCNMVFSRRDACHRHLKKRFTDGRCIKRKPKVDQIRCVGEFTRKMHVYEDGVDNYEWRAALPAVEKNRLARTALTQIKKNMF